jgi:hypothetical protein
MTSLKHFTIIWLLFFPLLVSAQQRVIKIIESGKRVSIRGLSVVNDNIVWASGSGGSVARSIDGGNTFTWMKVPGYEKSDFRDIEAFDANTALIMGITEPAVILKTKDGGLHWSKVFEDTTKGAFLDAMDFADVSHGVVVGDPITNNEMYAIATSNQGENWQKINLAIGKPAPYLMKEGEAFFASSGTNSKLLDAGFHSVFASGGKSSRLFYQSRIDSLPIMQGKESTGANSIAVYGNKAVIVGGDFEKDTTASNNCVLIDLNRTIHFTIPQTSPHGYRSCVIYLDKIHLLTCGTSGIDISNDGGLNWQLISKESFHVCQKAKNGKAVFLAGNGRIAKLAYP